MVYREQINWPPVREEEVLASVNGAERRETVILSSHDNVAPVEAVQVDPSRGLTQNQKVYRAGTVVAKITKDVGGGEAESGKWGPFDPAATDDGRDAQQVAFLVTGVVGNNNAIRWSAKQRGPAGRQVNVALVVAGNNTPLSVAVQNQFDVVVNVATDGAGAATSTAAQVIAAVNADADASQLVQAANEGASDGTGVVAAVAQANLAGGLHLVEIAVVPVDVNVQFGDVPAGAYVGNCTFRKDKLRGYAGNEANLDAALDAQNSRVIAVSEVSP
jgi:hypothetical protein